MRRKRLNYRPCKAVMKTGSLVMQLTCSVLALDGFNTRHHQTGISLSHLPRFHCSFAVWPLLGINGVKPAEYFRKDMASSDVCRNRSSATHIPLVIEQTSSGCSIPPHGLMWMRRWWYCFVNSAGVCRPRGSAGLPADAVGRVNLR